MGYVMVPVPEEHVEEAMGMILRISARSKLRAWDAESIAELFHDVDEPSRSVLSTISRGTLTGKGISDVETAETIEYTQREVLGIVRELNERAATDGWITLVAVTLQPEVLPNGRTREQRILSLDTDVAEHVRDAERAELAASPHPLLSDRG